jgi:hypothetical protein
MKQQPNSLDIVGEKQKNQYKVMKRIIFVIVFGIIATSLYSQFSIGAKAGMTISGFSNIRTETRAGTGYKAGLSAQYMFSRWGVQSGVYLSETGISYSEGLLPNKTGGAHFAILEATPKYLEVPLCAVYKYAVDDHVKLTFSAGVYYACGYGGGGTVRFDNGGYGFNVFDDIRIENDANFDFFAERASRNDYGSTVGIGVDIYRFNVSISYNEGFANVYRQFPIDPDSYDIRNRSIWLGIGYSFNL